MSKMEDSNGGVMDKKLGTRNDVALQIDSPTNYQDAFFTTSQGGNAKASYFPKNSQSGSSVEGSNIELSELENLRARLQTATNVPTFPDSGERAETPYAKDAIPKAEIMTLLNQEKNFLKSDDEEEDDDEEEYMADSKTKGKELKVETLTEFIAFLCITGLVIASLTIDRLKNCMIWDFELWKWSTLVLAIFSGRLFTECFKHVVFILIGEKLLKRKVPYFLHGLRKSVKAFICLALILIAWVLLFRRGVKRSRHDTRVLNRVTKALAGFLVGSGLWLLKTLLIKLLACYFHANRFFDDFRASVFHQYVLRRMQMAENIWTIETMPGQLSFTEASEQYEQMKKDEILVDNLKKMDERETSAWTKTKLISQITDSSLITHWVKPARSDPREDEQKEKEIRNKRQAKRAARRIFKNVPKRNSEYIEKEDLLQFMREEDVGNVIKLFPGVAKTRKIKRSMFKHWLLNVCRERQFLLRSFNNAKTVIEELNRLGSAVVLIIGIVLWLLIMGYLTTRILVFLSSQLLLVAFMFGNTAKTVFEGIIFACVMHPFDVGDRCVIDGVQMVVDEINLLTTIFLRYDKEMICYPNSVLATKPISNFRRSPKEMTDAVEFAIDLSTPVETIEEMEKSILGYLDSKPHHWQRGGHSVRFKEIENVDKMRMALYVTHTINFQNPGDRGKRISALVLELKNIFESHGIKYRLLPQEVQLSYVGTTAVPRPLLQDNGRSLSFM